MQQLFSFNSLPDLPTLRRRLWHMRPPFSIEIRQSIERVALSGDAHCYHELIDCDTVQDLCDFLHCDEYGVAPGEPFTVDVEEIESEPDHTWNDHPSLSISERN